MEDPSPFVSSVHAALREDLVKKPLLTLALSVLAATPALAQINLAWRNCITVTSGPNAGKMNQNSACDGTVVGFPGATYYAVVSFIAPANVTSFVGAKAILEVYAPQPTLPDYWRHGVGECRETSFSAGFTSGLGTGATGTCQDPYDGTVTREWTSISERPCADRATYTVQLTRESARLLTPGQQYMANTLVFDTNHAGDGVCPGCEIPAYLVVRQVEINQTSPLPTIVLPNPDVRNWVVWQGGSPELDGGACGHPVPTRNHTWGAIKAIYR